MSTAGPSLEVVAPVPPKPRSPRFEQDLGLRLLAAERSSVTVLCVPEPRHCNTAGILHGGYLAGVVDAVSGMVANLNVPKGGAPPHAATSIQYLRTATPHTRVTARADVLRAGRRLITTAVEIHCDDVLVVCAQTTHTVLDAAAVAALSIPST